MKKFSKILCHPLFAISHAASFSLGMSCLLCVFSGMLGATLDHKDFAERHPRFSVFCVVVGTLALIALITTIFLNVKLSEALGYKLWMWIIEAVCAFAISIPTMYLWLELFDFLQFIL